MTPCQLCSRFDVARWVLEYRDANVEYPDESTRYSHHSSFEDMEQAAADGCDLCGLIVKMFKSVDGRDKDSWEWPKDLLEKQNAGHVSVYNLVKGLPDLTHTRVQIYINTSHLYGANTMGEPPVLDIVMVHVGPHCKYERQVPTLKLKLRTLCPSENQLMQFWGHRIGSLPIDPYTGSDENFRLANDWLSTCKQHHDNCLSQRMPNLPTRVINVGDDPEYQDIRVEVPEPGTKAEYVALSHCWGGKITPTLGENNLEDFKDRLPFCSLPANFKDAIKVTRKLEIQYLWIDSLCILQGTDSKAKADWERESKKMTTVYRDSTLTLSAMSPEKSTDGFLTYEPDGARAANWEPVHVNFLLELPWMDVQATVERFGPKKEESLFDLEEEAPLARRGWTLQENVLSPRQLYYGANMIHWTCPSERQSANGMRGMHKDDKKYPALSRILFHDILEQQRRFPRNKKDVEEILWEYYTIINRYCARDLTYPSDKFPALSGITQRLQPVLGDYLAGLWRSDIVRGLWWVKQVGGGPVSKYRAPSWSWASVDGPVKCGECPNTRGSLDVQLLNCSIHPTNPDNPFGQVQSASLTLRGWTMKLDRPLKYRENPNEGIEDLFDLVIDEIPQDGNCHENPEWSKTFGVFLPGKDSQEQDDTIAGIGDASWIEIARYFMISGKYSVLLLRARPKEKGPRRQMWCLILESVHGLRHEVFKRVGTLEGYVSSESMKKWEHRELTLR